MASWQPVARVAQRIRTRARRASRAVRLAVAVPALVVCVGLLEPSAAAVRDTVPPPAAAVAAPRTTLTVVAHEDDDILFINPDVSRDLAAGRRVVTVYATAGDAGGTTAYWRGREAGAMAAYARMAGARTAWTVDRLRVAGHPIVRATLPGTSITLLFLRLPDGRGYAKHDFETMRLLWTGRLATIHAIDGSTAYTRESLTATLTALMDLYRPSVVRTLDYAGGYGNGDHSDHHSAAYFAHAAHRAYRTLHTFTGYLGYPMESFPVNLPAAARATKLSIFLAYARHDSHVCSTRLLCRDNAAYTARFARRYTSGHQLGGGRDVAPAATVSASSEDTATRRQAIQAVDGTVVGPTAREWATAGGGAGSWLALDWPAPQHVDRIALYDRPAAGDRITRGLLRFSDGSTVAVGALPDDGAALVVRFPARTVSGVRFEVTAVAPGTRSAGLAEIQVYAATPPA